MIRYAAGLDFGHKPRSERQAGSDFPIATFALPRNVAFSSTIRRGASMSPRNVQPAWSSQRSVTKILPSTVPRTFTDLVLISPRMLACSPIVSVPVESIVPSTSPSMNSPFWNLTDPLIETPRERKAPDCVGMKVRLDGLGTTDGSGRFVCRGSVPLRGEKRLKGCMAKIVPNYLANRKRNRSIENARGSYWLDPLGARETDRSSFRCSDEGDGDALIKLLTL